MGYPLPTVHLNGTSRAELEEGYRNACEALKAAYDALAAATCNARDYYVQEDPEAYSNARYERSRMLAGVDDAIDYALAHYAHLHCKPD